MRFLLAIISRSRAREVGMGNTCESALKDRKEKQAKVIVRLSQNGDGERETVSQ